MTSQFSCTNQPKNSKIEFQNRELTIELIVVEGTFGLFRPAMTASTGRVPARNRFAKITFCPHLSIHFLPRSKYLMSISRVNQKLSRYLSILSPKYAPNAYIDIKPNTEATVVMVSTGIKLISPEATRYPPNATRRSPGMQGRMCSTYAMTPKIR